MKRKIVSMLLGLIILIGMCVPAGASAITDGGLETSAEIFVESPERTDGDSSETADGDTLFGIEEPAKNDRIESTAENVRGGRLSGQELITIIGYKAMLRVIQIAQNSLGNIF